MIDNDKAVHRTAKRGAAIAAAVALAGMAVTAGSAIAQAEAPKYGGTVEIGSVYPTISALSWDLADWNWKQNYDTGQVYEHLFAADLSKAKRNGGKYTFQADAWLPEDAIRGELAESWKWTDPLTLEVKLRKGVKFPAKPGVMEERELVAEDVVFSYSRQEASAKKIPTYFDHLSKVEARDKHTVLFRFKEFNAEWDYRFGWGYYSGIMPKEVATAGAANWKNVNGTGPFTLTQFVQGNASTYTKIRSTGTASASATRTTSCPSSTRWCCARSSTRPRATRCCAPASSTSWRACAGPRWTNSSAARRSCSGRVGCRTRASIWRCASTPSRSTISASGGR